MSTPEERLDALMTDISNLVDFQHNGSEDGYTASADAMWKAALAAFNFAAKEVGATGFQASWAALKFYSKAMHIDSPFIILKVEDALYPQYDLPARLQTFLAEQRDWLREQAKEKLAGDLTWVASSVVAHWKRLTVTS